MSSLRLKNSIGVAALAVVQAAVAFLPVSAQANEPAGVAHQSRLQESRFKSIVTFYQHFAEDGTVAITSKVGPLTKSEGGYGIERNTQDLTIQTFSGFPRALTPNLGPAATLSQEQALNTAALWTTTNANSTARRMSEEIRAAGASGGILTYAEEVYISREEGAPVKKLLSFLMSVDRDGKATYGNPVLQTPEPDVLYVAYTPLRPGDDFNENWVLPHAGEISYQVLDHKGRVKIDTRYINVSGAYDTPPGKAEVADCFIDNKSTGCNVPSGTTDVRSLMMRYAADFAIVDFTRKIIPLYDEVPNGTGSPDYIPRMALSYNDRTWNCVEYSNTGEYGFALDLVIDRWYAKLGADLQLEKQFISTNAGTMLSPVNAFHKTVLAASLTSHPDYFVISPIEGDSTLYRVGSTELRGVTHIAPVRSAADTNELLNARVTGSFPLSKTDGGEGWSIFTYGIVGDNYYGGGNYYGSIDFNLKSINDFKEVSLLTQNFDDWLLITINGTPVFSGPYDGITSITPTNARVEYDNCANYGGTWKCGGQPFIISEYTSAELAWGQSYREPLREYKCSVRQYDSESGNSYQRCVGNPSRAYGSCIDYSSSGDESTNGSSYFYCSNSKVCTYQSLEYTMWDGSVQCGNHERSVSWNRSYERTILPYLRKGDNSLKASLFVGGEGEMFVRFRVQGCGTEWGLPFTGAPAIPNEGTKQGVLEKLSGQLNRPAN